MNLGIIAEICDRVIVMRQGEIVEHGEVSRVVNQPSHEYTRLLIGSQPARLHFPSSTIPRRSSLLDVNNLRVQFGGNDGVRAVDDVSLEVFPGEIFGVVGESGSGKSTLARVLTRLTTPTAGTITYKGDALAALSGPSLQSYRRQVQMVFQNPYDSINPRMTVLDSIAEPIWRHGICGRPQAQQKALALMEMVELSPDLAKRRPRQLSGGQCQRVAIARALSLEPSLLIADEVTSALDVTIQAQVLALLSRLHRLRSLTIIYISHDLGVVQKFCDRVAVFRQGKLVECGMTSDVFSNPSSQYTRTLIASAPRIQGMNTHSPE